jgi:putative ABC transport system permease protein
MPTERTHSKSPSPLDTVQRQIVLPFATSVVIAFRSMRVRFVRSLITVTSLVLAIAFFCFVNVGTDVANALLATGDIGLRETLIENGYDIQPDQNRIDNTPKQKWIVALSLLVCVVGIVNAQLMAVTERFREIGTMKCLGALDRFILRLFLLEAGMQGLAGSLAGAFLGALFAILNGVLRFGGAAFTSLEWDAAGVSIAMAAAVGLVLSLAGVFYPAMIAARMQPVEAMRAEE